MSWFLRVSVSVGREGCISFQTWNPVAETCSRLQICFAIWLHLSTGWCASTHGKAGSRLIATNCSEFIGKDKWPPNSPDLNPLDYHVWGAILECYKPFRPSRRTSMCSRKFCSWYGTSSHKTLVFVMTVSVSWQWKLQLAVDYSVQNWKYGIEYLCSHNFGEN